MYKKNLKVKEGLLKISIVLKPNKIYELRNKSKIKKTSVRIDIGYIRKCDRTIQKIYSKVF